MSNCFTKDLAKVKVTIKNPALEKLLDEKGYNNTDTWANIRDNDGSVQHLDFLTDHEKAVFRTFAEIDQRVIIEQAADRQKFIDQAHAQKGVISVPQVSEPAVTAPVSSTVPTVNQ
jgi:ribonucleoside-diphosphate reductase alpha chain